MMLLKHTFIMVSYCQFRHAVYFKNIRSSSVPHIMTQSWKNQREFIHILNNLIRNCVARDYIAPMHYSNPMVEIMKRVTFFVIFGPYLVDKLAKII